MKKGKDTKVSPIMWIPPNAAKAFDKAIKDDLKAKGIEFKNTTIKMKQQETNPETVGAGIPKEHKLPTKTAGLTYGEAKQLLDAGYPMTRNDWIKEGDSYFVFKQVPSLVPKDVIPKMTSLPQPVKDVFNRMIKENIIIDGLHYFNQYCIVENDNHLTMWVARQKDIEANDWLRVE